MGQIHVARINELTVVVHKTKDIINLIRSRGGLVEGYTGLASASVVNAVKTANTKIYAFGVDRIDPDEAIEYPPLKIYRTLSNETILSTANLVLASYVDLSFIFPQNSCEQFVLLYEKGLHKLTRALEFVL